MTRSLTDERDPVAGRPEPGSALTEVDWARAADFPELVSPAWRDGARFRQLAMQRLAGSRYLVLPGFVERRALERLRQLAKSLPFARMETDLVRARRRLLAEDELPEWRAFMQHEVTRSLFGAAVGRALPIGLVVNAWRLDPGDHIGEHPDGPLYHGTISLGLNRDWSDDDGGAIAFRSGERWLPQAGDVCVFAPAEDTFHHVEPVRRRTRYSVTGWWVEERDAL